MVQGTEVLRAIERVPTHYESPNEPIEIVDCGEFTLYDYYTEQDLGELDKYLSTAPEQRAALGPPDVDSCPDIRRYRRGLYCHPLDMQSYLPEKPPSAVAYASEPAGEAELQSYYAEPKDG